MVTVAGLKPGVTLQVRIEIDSPTVTHYRGEYQLPKAAWVDFARGDDEEQTRLSAHECALDGVISGTQLRVDFGFVGNPRSQYSASVYLSQEGVALGEPQRVNGTLNDDGAGVDRVEVALQ